MAELWNLRAGGLTSFARYSRALESPGIIWEESTHAMSGYGPTRTCRSPPKESDYWGRADNICSLRDLPPLTRSGHITVLKARDAKQVIATRLFLRPRHPADGFRMFRSYGQLLTLNASVG